MTKTIMSIAASVALLTSGAMAFNTNTAGEILASASIDGNYSWDATINAAATNVLEIDSTTAHGDALIYPYFTQQDGWSTEVYVRNDSDKSIVAKVALYTANNSLEVKDFNIYLSPNDVFRFKIQNNTIQLNEDSVVTSAPRPEDNDNLREHLPTQVKFGDTNPVDIEFKAESGYVVIYGMAETPDIGHHKHVQLFGEYRNLLDEKRTEWRDGFGQGGVAHFVNGTYRNGIAAPGLLETVAGGTTWNDVNETALTGTIRVMKDADADNGARDMLIPATPMKNYTDGNIMVWTEGETASLADRRMDANTTTATVADYSANGLTTISPIMQDAYAFRTEGFYFRFDNAEGGSIANNLIFTQPLKRVLTQLGNLDNIWSPVTGVPVTGWVTGLEYEFVTECGFWDEKEVAHEDPADEGNDLITSPYTGIDGILEFGYNQEVQILKDEDLEKGDLFEGKYDNVNGYVSCNIDNGLSGWMPAMVSQMVGSDVGGNAMTNWVYSVTKSF